MKIKFFVLMNQVFREGLISSLQNTAIYRGVACINFLISTYISNEDAALAKDLWSLCRLVLWILGHTWMD